MAALIERHAEELVARLQQRHEHGLVGLRARVRLHVGEGAVEEFPGALDRQVLGLVHFLAAAVVAATRIAFGIFVGQYRARRLEHGPGNDVLRRDQFDQLALAVQFALQDGVDRRIGLGDAHGEHR